MRPLICYIASSLDGYIAGPNDELDWLPPLNEGGEDYGYAEFMKTVDTTLMGRRTYDVVEAMNEPALNPGKTNYVFSSRPASARYDNVRFVADEPVAFVKNLKEQPGSGIWLEGGGAILKLLLEAGLVDEVRLFIVPVLLGDGISLFQKMGEKRALKLIRSVAYPDGMVGLSYSS